MTSCALGFRRARVPELTMILSVLSTLTGCFPRLLSEPGRGVEFPDPWIPEDELKLDRLVWLRIHSEYALPVVEVRVEFPFGLDALGTPLIRTGESEWRKSLHRRGNPEEGEAAYLEVTAGEIPCGQFETVAFFVEHTEARVGDTLAFPVTLLLSDSSLVEWAGLPGSERPAPILLVGEAPPRLPARAVITAGILAALILIFVGIYMIRRWRSPPVQSRASQELE